MELPKIFREYMGGNGPKEGELAVEPGWFQLWPVEKIEELNKGYKTAEFVPGFTGFGSNGGGEMFAFGPEGQIVMIPFVPMDADEAVLVADSWVQFEKAIVE